MGTSGPPGGGGGPDASSGGGDGPTGSIDAPAGSGSGSGSNGCLNQSANLPDGHHNPGQDCMNGCHNHGFTLSGTIYTSVNSNTAVVGATVVATDANNQVIKMVTATNGNFYTTSPVTFPVTVLATECPNITPMSAQLTSGQGGCNKVGCHTAGAQGHIHLP
ncbi:MAG: hypothetical protein JO257_03095 [Deltaproteobacteria bacterium]|nr:hypothetical protein [Deltaproteobacteria bacterium]